MLRIGKTHGIRLSSIPPPNASSSAIQTDETSASGAAPEAVICGTGALTARARLAPSNVSPEAATRMPSSIVGVSAMPEPSSASTHASPSRRTGCGAA